jgi:hypothetical protein
VGGSGDPVSGGGGPLAVGRRRLRDPGRRVAGAAGGPRPRGARDARGGILTAALGGLFGRRHPLLAAAAERPFTKLPALDNCSVSVLEWPGPELRAFNDTAHLDMLEAPRGAAE